VPSDFESQPVKTETQVVRLEHEAEDAKIRAEQEAKKVKAKAHSKLAKGKKSAQDNPVFYGNAVLVGVLGTVLGVGAYKKYAAGDLSWKTAGIWAGAVGLFAGADYLATRYVLALSVCLMWITGTSPG
jgi:hypothetical protein